MGIFKFKMLMNHFYLSFSNRFVDFHFSDLERYIPEHSIGKVTRKAGINNAFTDFFV